MVAYFYPYLDDCIGEYLNMLLYMSISYLSLLSRVTRVVHWCVRTILENGYK